MTLGMFVFTGFTDQVPGGAAQPSVPTVAGPASTVLTSGVVALALRVTSTSRVGHPHVVGHRVLKVSAANVTCLTDPVRLLLALLARPAVLLPPVRVVTLVATSYVVGAGLLQFALVPGIESALLHDSVEAIEDDAFPQENQLAKCDW